MAVFTAQALLGLNLFECLLCGSGKTLLSAVRRTQHRQCSGALTLLVLKVMSGCHFVPGETLSSPISIFSLPERKQPCAHIDIWLKIYCDI